MEDQKAIGKAQKDVQEILLLGSTEEREALLDELNKNKSLSILEKKVYVCLIHYKNQKFSTAKELIEELIFDIGGLQEQQQAKVYLLKAQIYEKLQGNDISLYKKEIQDSLDKSYQIFRNRKFNKIQFDVHHYLLQIADMQIRQKQNEEGEQIYELIFTQSQNCRYPNDWAIFIQAYLRYFESRLRGNSKIESKLFESCLKTMNEKYLDKNNLHKMLYYKAVNSLLSLREPEEFFQTLKQCELSYWNKNKIKKNHKMIYFVDQFITADDNLGLIIQIIPIFLKLGEQFKQIVKNRLILLYQEQSLFESQLNEKEKELKQKREQKLNEIYSKYSENLINNYVNQQKEIKSKIETLNIELKKLKEEIQKQNEKQQHNLQNDNLKKLEQLIKEEEKNLKLKEEENLNLINEIQNNQELQPQEQQPKKQQPQEQPQELQPQELQPQELQYQEQKPQEFEVYKKIEEYKQSEQSRYELLLIDQQKHFVRKYTLDPNQKQKIIDLQGYLNQNKTYYKEEIKKINQNLLSQNEQQNNLHLQLKQKIIELENINQINEYCCFEFIQLEEFGIASTILEQINLSPIKIILTLLLFSNLPYESGLKLLQDQTIQQDKIIYEKRKKYKQFVHIQQSELQKEIIQIQNQFQKIDDYLYSEGLNKFYDYAYNQQGCLYYLIDDIKNQRFYDPHVYEFKNIIYDIIYNFKGRNSQALFFDGSTYADILKKFQNSWKLEQKQ